MTPARKLRIVFATNSEAGQLNVQLAVIHSLLEHHSSEVELNLCSFAPARSRCPSGVTFHGVPGPSFKDAIINIDTPEVLEATLLHRPTFLGVFKAALFTPALLSPQSPSEYINTAKSIEEALQSTQPDLVVIDNIFPQARDAASRLGLAYIILSPNAWQDNAFQAQGSGVFSWPLTGTGWRYPLPLYLIPLNAILILTLVLAFALNTKHRAKLAARKEAGYMGSMMGGPDEIHLCMGLPELEVTGVRPANVIPIGPMCLPCPPLESVDSDLDAWINSAGSEEMFIITFALGTHAELDPARAEGLLKMFAGLLEENKNLRIYAKIMRKGGFELPLLADLQEEFGLDRLRVVEWVKTDPIVLLNTGKVGLVIHHGGSNSYHEALCLGIPQIIVGSWFDCYDFAIRAETLGIGKWGNRKAGPIFTASELGSTIREIIASYPRFKARAVACAEVAAQASARVREHDGSAIVLPTEVKAMSTMGRDVAAEWIIGKARSLAER